MSPVIHFIQDYKRNWEEHIEKIGSKKVLPKVTKYEREKCLGRLLEQIKRFYYNNCNRTTATSIGNDGGGGGDDDV
jgi:hypothetical protein